MVFHIIYFLALVFIGTSQAKQQGTTPMTSISLFGDPPPNTVKGSNNLIGIYPAGTTVTLRCSSPAADEKYYTFYTWEQGTNNKWESLQNVSTSDTFEFRVYSNRTYICTANDEEITPTFPPDNFSNQLSYLIPAGTKEAEPLRGAGDDDGTTSDVPSTTSCAPCPCTKSTTCPSCPCTTTCAPCAESPASGIPNAVSAIPLIIFGVLLTFV